MKPLLLWSDILIYLLVVALCVFFLRLRRRDASLLHLPFLYCWLASRFHLQVLGRDALPLVFLPATRCRHATWTVIGTTMHDLAAPSRR